MPLAREGPESPLTPPDAKPTLQALSGCRLVPKRRLVLEGAVSERSHPRGRGVCRPVRSSPAKDAVTSVSDVQGEQAAEASGLGFVAPSSEARDRPRVFLPSVWEGAGAARPRLCPLPLRALRCTRRPPVQARRWAKPHGRGSRHRGRCSARARPSEAQRQGLRALPFLPPAAAPPRPRPSPHAPAGTHGPRGKRSQVSFHPAASPPKLTA